MTAPTLEYREEMGCGENAWGKSLAFPQFTRFSQLFSEWKPWSADGSKPYRGLGPKLRGMGDYCGAHSTDLVDSLRVKARPEIGEWTIANMILPDYDAFVFKLAQRADGILVIVQPQQILASRWLALLDTEQTLFEIKHHRLPAEPG